MEEHFLEGEQFGESPFFVKSTLRRALLERKALWGEHYWTGEQLGGITSWLESFFWRALFVRIALCGEHSFFVDEHFFLKGRELYATMDRGRTYWLFSLERIGMRIIFIFKKNCCILRFWSKSVGRIGWVIICMMSREDQI